MEAPPLARRLVHSIQPNGDEAPIFFLMHAETAIPMLREIVPALGPDRPIFGLGVGTWAENLPDLKSVEEIAREAVRQIRSTYPGGAVILAGHSFGGLVAFEAARVLAEGGQGPEMLILIDAVPVGALSLMTGMRMMRRRLRMGILLIVPASVRPLLRWARDRGLGRSPSTKAESAHFEAESLAARWRRPPNWNGFPKTGVLRDLSRAYRPRSYGGRVVLYRTQRSLDHYRDPALGWGRSVQGSLQLDDLTGTHGGAVRPPTISALGEKLAARLGKSSAS